MTKGIGMKQKEINIFVGKVHGLKTEKEKYEIKLKDKNLQIEKLNEGTNACDGDGMEKGEGKLREIEKEVLKQKEEIAGHTEMSGGGNKEG